MIKEIILIWPVKISMNDLLWGSAEIACYLAVIFCIIGIGLLIWILCR